jgi:glucuronate isomerase
LLNEYGNNPDFHFVAFTIDETVYSRELAPLAGYYPSVYVGAPWWFIDAPESIERYFAAVVPYAGFTKLSGFIDDTRALCSIPSRHDMNRRVTAGYIAKLVADHRISKDEGLDLVRYAISMHPREVFKL